MPDFRGSCLRGAVAFEYTGPIHGLQACHGLRCRKFYGSAFGPIAIINREGFAFTSGNERIRSFPSSARVNRYFCRTSGAPLPVEEEWEPLVGVPLGLVEGDLGQVMGRHIFVGSRAPWCEVAGDGVQHEAWPPNEDMNERFGGLIE
jgi:hypothetical protein